MSKRLPNNEVFTVNRYAHQPITGPFEIGYFRMLELSMTVWTEDQQIGWVMADLGIKMVYFKVRLAVPFFECERTKLTLPIMQFTEQNANSRRNTLVAFGSARNTLGRGWRIAPCAIRNNSSWANSRGRFLVNRDSLLNSCVASESVRATFSFCRA